MFGLGKPRTLFGRFMDRNGYKQGELPLDKNTASKLCNDAKYDPTPGTKSTAVGFLRRRGHDVRPEDFWA